MHQLTEEGNSDFAFSIQTETLLFLCEKFSYLGFPDMGDGLPKEVSSWLVLVRLNHSSGSVKISYISFTGFPIKEQSFVLTPEQAQQFHLLCITSNAILGRNKEQLTFIVLFDQLFMGAVHTFANQTITHLSFKRTVTLIKSIFEPLKNSSEKEVQMDLKLNLLELLSGLTSTQLPLFLDINFLMEASNFLCHRPKTDGLFPLLESLYLVEDKLYFLEKTYNSTMSSFKEVVKENIHLQISDFIAEPQQLIIYKLIVNFLEGRPVLSNPIEIKVLMEILSVSKFNKSAWGLFLKNQPMIEAWLQDCINWADISINSEKKHFVFYKQGILILSVEDTKKPSVVVNLLPENQDAIAIMRFLNVIHQMILLAEDEDLEALEDILFFRILAVLRINSIDKEAQEFLARQFDLLLGSEDFQVGFESFNQALALFSFEKESYDIPQNELFRLRFFFFLMTSVGLGGEDTQFLLENIPKESGVKITLQVKTEETEISFDSDSRAIGKINYQAALHGLFNILQMVTGKDVTKEMLFTHKKHIFIIQSLMPKEWLFHKKHLEYVFKDTVHPLSSFLDEIKTAWLTYSAAIINQFVGRMLDEEGEKDEEDMASLFAEDLQKRRDGLYKLLKGEEDEDEYDSPPPRKINSNSFFQNLPNINVPNVIFSSLSQLAAAFLLLPLRFEKEALKALSEGLFPININNTFVIHKLTNGALRLYSSETSVIEYLRYFCSIVNTDALISVVRKSVSIGKLEKKVSPSLGQLDQQRHLLFDSFSEIRYPKRFTKLDMEGLQAQNKSLLGYILTDIKGTWGGWVCSSKSEEAFLAYLAQTLINYPDFQVICLNMCKEDWFQLLNKILKSLFESREEKSLQDWVEHLAIFKVDPPILSPQCLSFGNTLTLWESDNAVTIIKLEETAHPNVSYMHLCEQVNYYNRECPEFMEYLTQQDLISSELLEMFLNQQADRDVMLTLLDELRNTCTS